MNFDGERNAPLAAPTGPPRAAFCHAGEHFVRRFLAGWGDAARRSEQNLRGACRTRQVGDFYFRSTIFTTSLLPATVMRA